MHITLEHHPDEEKLRSLGVFEWPVWSKEVSEFPWEYTAPETCYILEGEVTVTPEGGEPVHIQAGDLVTFHAGLRCTWNITRPIRKHYSFG